MQTSEIRRHVLKSEMSSQGTFWTEQDEEVCVPFGLDTTLSSHTKLSFSQKKSHAS